jgi:hypothetical protein
LPALGSGADRDIGNGRLGSERRNRVEQSPSVTDL